MVSKELDNVANAIGDAFHTSSVGDWVTPARAALEELLAHMKGPGQAEVRAILDEKEADDADD